MQFFWSALKLIIPLSSCVFFFFSKKKCYTFPFLPNRHLARKNYLRQPPKNPYNQRISIDVRWSSWCKVPTKANQLLPSLRPLFVALTRGGGVSLVYSNIGITTCSEKKDLLALKLGAKLMRFWEFENFGS